MSTDTTKSEAMADLDSVMASITDKMPIDPALVQRVRVRAAEVRQRLPKTNIAVDLIREFRDQ